VLIPFLECHLVEGLSQLLKLLRVQYAFQREACECRTTHVTTPRQLTYYGSAPREHWTEPAKFAEDLQDQLVLEEESFLQVRLLDPEDLSLLKEIAEGGQAHVFLVVCEKFSTLGVVKRLKGGQVDLLQLRRRMDKVMEIVRKNSSAICNVMAVEEDNMAHESLNWPPRHFESYSLLQKSMCTKIGESRIS
jgi:hypothetical protein